MPLYVREALRSIHRKFCIDLIRTKETIHIHGFSKLLNHIMKYEGTQLKTAQVKIAHGYNITHNTIEYEYYVPAEAENME